MIIHAIKTALNKSDRNNKGFTLVEVIISIAALGIICAVLLRLFVLAGTTNDQANKKQEAQLTVNATVELLVCSDTVYDALTALNISFSGNIQDDTFICPDDGYDVVIVLAKRSGEYPGTLYDLRVSAMGADGELASISTSTYYKEQTHD